MSSALVTRLTCRECGTAGDTVELDATVRGVALGTVSRLPACMCFLRANKGKAPANVTSLLATTPLLNDQLALIEEKPSIEPGESSRQSGSRSPDHVSTKWRPPRVRQTYDASKMNVSRELMVYQHECSEEALLGTVVLLPEHKLGNVLQMLREELEVDAASVSRGMTGSALKVPIHKNQYRKSALQFFPSKRHCLLVMEFAEEGSEEGD